MPWGRWSENTFFPNKSWLHLCEDKTFLCHISSQNWQQLNRWAHCHTMLRIIISWLLHYLKFMSLPLWLSLAGNCLRQDSSYWSVFVYHPAHSPMLMAVGYSSSANNNMWGTLSKPYRPQTHNKLLFCLQQ